MYFSIFVQTDLSFAVQPFVGKHFHFVHVDFPICIQIHFHIKLVCCGTGQTLIVNIRNKYFNEFSRLLLIFKVTNDLLTGFGIIFKTLLLN